jgi:hypothetical protein
MSIARSEKIALVAGLFIAALGVTDAVSESRSLHLTFLSTLVAALAVGSGYAAISAVSSGVANGKAGVRAERKYQPIGYWSLVLMQAAAFLGCLYGIVRLVPLWIAR